MYANIRCFLHSTKLLPDFLPKQKGSDRHLAAALKPVLCYHDG